MLKTPKTPPDIVTTLCAVLNLVAIDPKKLKFLERQLGKKFDLNTAMAFAIAHIHNKEK